jgi:hypothetical protein
LKWVEICLGNLVHREMGLIFCMFDQFLRYSSSRHRPRGVTYISVTYLYDIFLISPTVLFHAE